MCLSTGTATINTFNKPRKVYVVRTVSKAGTIWSPYWTSKWKIGHSRTIIGIKPIQSGSIGRNKYHFYEGFHFCFTISSAMLIVKSQTICLGKARKRIAIFEALAEGQYARGYYIGNERSFGICTKLTLIREIIPTNGDQNVSNKQ